MSTNKIGWVVVRYNVLSQGYFVLVILPNTKQNLEDLIKSVRDRKIEWSGLL